MTEDAREADQVVALKRLASNGGFAVDERTGEKMIRALQGIVDALEARWPALQRFAGSPRLSSTATARWVSHVMVRTAGDDRGLLTRLQQARAELPTYIEAIRLAQENYRPADGDTAATLHRYRA
ncbi:hypothetical protein [Amycolatopsis thermalba]|uniref:hypothetical protein n=1 Tax=Amycolatopsis thermalba TaxID=944492 RepID=UPI000E269729|nr:hypothetical protein [Amycolatopsis thermalba]